MEWMTWARFWEIENKALPEVAGSELPVSPQAKTFDEAWANIQSECDWESREAVRQFAKQKAWPALTPGVRFLLKARLDYAQELAQCLAVTHAGKPLVPSPRNSAKDEAIILWFLEDVWRAVGSTTRLEIVKASIRDQCNLRSGSN
jgi:hypothetical protein